VSAAIGRRTLHVPKRGRRRHQVTLTLDAGRLALTDLRRLAEHATAVLIVPV